MHPVLLQGVFHSRLERKEIGQMALGWLFRFPLINSQTLSRLSDDLMTV
jgi:hypothetical protein